MRQLIVGVVCVVVGWMDELGGSVVDSFLGSSAVWAAHGGLLELA